MCHTIKVLCGVFMNLNKIVLCLSISIFSFSMMSASIADDQTVNEQKECVFTREEAKQMRGNFCNDRYKKNRRTHTLNFQDFCVLHYIKKHQQC